MNDITVLELKKRIDEGTAPKVIDVRENWEYEGDHIEAENIPMGDIPARLEYLSSLKEEELVICCRSGGRSGQIKSFLLGQGFSKARNLTGGMLAWKDQIDSSVKVS